MNYKYEVSATLSEKSPTYVRRQADNQLYDSLKAGHFCYVFNARKTGKSSLRVQVMSRLKAAGVACSIIDISSKNTQQTTLQQWYAGILNDITKDFDLDINLRSWIKERNWLSPLEQFREFIESILFKELSEDIVIFIDEIDSVLSLNFQSDDFFAFIRACYNRRVDIPEYNRLTFCLLGVATPSDLIADKNRTPFNIGQAIELTGFRFEEASLSLIHPLVPKVDNPEAVLKEILEWTQGQPFLTQKLCKLVIEQAESKQPNIEQIVQKYIIENWQSQDEPEHLKTISNRLTSNEQRAGCLLELYQQILLKGSVAADNSSEQGTMLLSGLVVRQEGKLEVYNRVYQCVFNLYWVERELAKLRPYAEALKAWIDSGFTDESRLLRGEALSDALIWAENKSLGLSDYQFFQSSQELSKREIQRVRELENLESEINLKAERKKLEATDKANKILKAANQKAKRQVRIGSVILAFSLIVVILAGTWAFKTITETQQAIRLEQAGLNATQLFESQEIEPLLLAMQAGQELQEVLNSGRTLKEYPADSPRLALKIILDNINEQNQLTEHTGAIRSANFSHNGQHIVTASWDKTARVWDIKGKPLAVLNGHTGAVLSASFSHNGQRIVTTSDDKTARVWDISGKLLAELNGHTGAVLSANFSPDGQHIVTASLDKTARVWDIKGKPLAELNGHTDPVLSAGFSHNGQHIVTASFDNTARVWDISGKLLAELKEHTGAVLSASFSHNGQHIVTASDDKTARVWDISGNQLAVLIGHTDKVNSASFSPDGQHIVTASFDKTARLWDIFGKQIAQLTGHIDQVNSANFSQDGQHIITASNDGTALVWDISGKQIAQLKGHVDAILNASFSPDGQHIVTASYDNTARLWDIRDKQLAQLKEHTGRVRSSSFSPDGQHIVTASDDKTAQVWNLKGKKLAVLKGHTKKVNSANFSHNGRLIVTASDDSTARLWDIRGKPLAVLEGHTDIVNSANFSHDGKRIATASDDNTARVWDISGNQLAELKGHTGIVWSANFSPDGKRIVTASFDDTAQVWDIFGNKLAELKGHTDGVRSAIFSPSGRLIVTASRDNTARVWNISGEQLAVLEGHTYIVRSASFSHDSKSIVTASFDNTARVWDISGKQLTLLKGHISRVNSASFSHNGQLIVTASDDKTARVWDISGKQLALLKGHISRVNSASFSHNGQRIITASDDHTARIWQVEDLNQLLVRGCKWLNNYLITHPKDLEKLEVCQN
ncbi:WD-40 repeat protein [Calothrix sp. NIES-4071]|nr:WD-40 repeat protein [Calothrix sp. NIES-4071]BAZ54992.1 WD-40 repeat protein [Calothrix sp. NIES-4105]